MKPKMIIVLIIAIFLASCAAPTPQATVAPQTSEVSETSEVLTSTSTQTPASTPTSTVTPEPYGEIDPNIAERLKAEGIQVPEGLLDPEYKLDLATEYQETHWCTAFGDLSIPITVIPEQGIVDGMYHITGIGMTDEACTAYAEAHIKYMWIHYREYGNPADRDITLEAYVELLRQGRGGFEIPQYNPETGLFDLKAMINPLAGYTIMISDNERKDLPLKTNTESSALYYVDENGMLWVAGNDLEFSIKSKMDPNNDFYKKNPHFREPSLASGLITGFAMLGLSSDYCLSTDVAVTSCALEVAKTEDKYPDLNNDLTKLFEEWAKEYKAGDHNAQPPMTLQH